MTATRIQPSDSSKWFPMPSIPMGLRWRNFQGKRLEWSLPKGEGACVGWHGMGRDDAGTDRDIDSNGYYSNARRQLEDREAIPR